jgi:hypothetical protein
MDFSGDPVSSARAGGQNPRVALIIAATPTNNHDFLI